MSYLKILVAAACAAAALAAPTVAQADPAICHNGVLSDDAGQGCADGLYAQVYGSGGSGSSGICHDGILSNDAGQGCADGLYERVYGSGGSGSPPVVARAPVSTSSGGAGGSLASIRACESTNNYQAVDPSGTYTGAYQFDDQTWHSVGGVGRAGNASPAEQDRRAAMLLAQRGSSPWPNCG